MEKQLSLLGYWLGLVCVVLALIFRLLVFFGAVPIHIGPAGGTGVSYMTFLHGAGLFFVLTIASWCRTARS
jgi:hypothetical protein